MDLTQLNDYTTRSEAVCRRNDTISPRLYEEYGVKKGLRDENGNGVLAGLTNISKITSSKIVDGKKVPCDGQLWYRGYRVEDLIGSLGERNLATRKSPTFCLWGSCRTALPRKNSGGCWASAGRSPPTSPGTSS